MTLLEKLNTIDKPSLSLLQEGEAESIQQLSNELLRQRIRKCPQRKG